MNIPTDTRPLKARDPLAYWWRYNLPSRYWTSTMTPVGHVGTEILRGIHTAHGEGPQS